jgi:predicted dienelactone hydrolase
MGAVKKLGLSMLLAGLAAIGHGQPVNRSMGLADVPASGDLLKFKVAYPSSTAATELRGGPFKTQASPDGALARESLNGKLVVLSHGTGGGYWPQLDLAQALVNAGFVVAMPSHRGDNQENTSDSGPASWKRRPGEISQAIDAVLANPRFAQALDTQRVGVYGMSAGGLTALTLAGAKWSPAQFARHCETHIAQDFHTCVGVHAQLTGGVMDGVKVAVARSVIQSRFSDETWYEHHDPRVAAVVSAVPLVVAADLDSLRKPRVPLGLLTSEFDAWLAPRFHRDPLLAACLPCERVVHQARGGHASTLSPWPSAELNLGERLNKLLADPPGFDRSTLPADFAAIAQFFVKKLRD